MAVNISDAEWNKLQEAVGILAGWRPLKGDKPMRAATQKDIAELRRAISTLQSVLTATLAPMTASMVTAAPTAAQHNALVADVTALHDALSAIISAAAR